ncbi:ferredoxin--NADP reductase [Brackiella oedipodis]|uniref:ferredoxin--NADP reductase n=1 Tax=Brackiella oedipodis TaxID=124225 RepID=UPI00048BDB65|nr:ferredoxin--NADP reductase [Brackiella oedipodis]
MTVNYTEQKVIAIHQWIPGKLFSIRTTRDADFEFKPGQFARIGLCSENATEPDIWRGFSMVNDSHSDYLEFYVVVVPEGQFSPKLAQLQVGDSLYINKTVFGFLTIDQFPQGGTLWLLATGTGLSAYLSILKDPQTWQLFDHVILCHGVREIAEFTYLDQIQSTAKQWPERFVYLPIATRQAHLDYPQARLTELISNGKLEQLAGHPLDPEQARVMLCGNPEMLKDARKLLSDKGFAAGRRGNIGTLAAEKYW